MVGLPVGDGLAPATATAYPDISYGDKVRSFEGPLLVTPFLGPNAFFLFE